MPALRYWDATQNQWILLPGSQGQTYAQVTSGAAPNPNAPVLSPPMGALWVDTSTTAPATPYVPTTTPPPSGTNSYTDAAGEAWISRNGSAWKKARDVLHARVYRNAAYSFTTSPTQVAFDIVTRDPYGMWNPSAFTAPVAGIYLVSAQITASMGAAGQFANIYVMQSGTQVGWNGFNASGVGYVPCLVTDRYNLAYGDTIFAQAYASATVSGVTGSFYSFLSIDYLGTG